MSYTITHLKTPASYERASVFINPHQNLDRTWQQDIDPAVEAFHKNLPYYAETKLHSLPSTAAELGFKHVFIKDESTRFGLSAFKILGASWAIHQAICSRLNLSKQSSLDDVTKALTACDDDVRLVLCTEGNWGRACARMAKYLGVPCKIYVPGFMNEFTQDLLRSEGADVEVQIEGSYDDTITAAREDAQVTGALLTLDTSWEGYEECPGWVTQGYSTMLAEADRQIASYTSSDNCPILAVASVGVGSWAQAVVEHYRSDSSNKIITVEPAQSGASFKESLHVGAITPVQTGETIMNGMNCGTTSGKAWPTMRDGVYAAVAVEDMEVHECVQELQSEDVNAGPCGAATLVALRKLCEPDDTALGREQRKDMVAVLFSTEGGREYEIPSSK